MIFVHIVIYSACGAAAAFLYVWMLYLEIKKITLRRRMVFSPLLSFFIRLICCGALFFMSAYDGRIEGLISCTVFFLVTRYIAVNVFSKAKVESHGN
jgi:hypothetical protein